MCEEFVTATLCYFGAPVNLNFISDFENTIQPVLMKAGAKILACFVTEDCLNTFPALPVREGEHVFVWSVGFQDQTAYEYHVDGLAQSKIWKEEISKSLKRRLKRKPEVLRLSPTSRSRLT